MMTEQSPRDGLVSENIEAQIEAWFFRDLYDAHRKALIARCLGDGAADEAHQHGVQRMVLHRIIRSLRTSHPNAAEPKRDLSEHPCWWPTVRKLGHRLHSTKDGWQPDCERCGTLIGLDNEQLPDTPLQWGRAVPPAPQDDARANVRGLGQAEGKAAVLTWLRDLGARKPPATLWHAATILADQFEQSERPGAALNPTGADVRGLAEEFRRVVRDADCPGGLVNKFDQLKLDDVSRAAEILAALNPEEGV